MNKSFTDLFEEQVLQNPNNVAVVFEGKQVSYQQLNDEANRLACCLQTKGVKQETLVPLFIERGIGMIIGILGIMKAGGAYVPIDTDFPAGRINYILQHTAAKITVSSTESSSKLIGLANIEIIAIDTLADQPYTVLLNKVLPNQLAYIIYTSGSTGLPKGVMIEHKSLVDYVNGLINKIAINECNSFALVSSIATDLGNTVIYSSLATGGALHIFSKETVSSIELLHQYFDQFQIDCLKIVPSHWKALNMDGQFLLPKKLLIFGGENLPETIVTNIFLSGATCKVVNHYGPTETTIGKLLHVADAASTYEFAVPIGKPFSNTNVLILTNNLKLCPIGIVGQLFITGDGLARGYLNNSELTNEKFIKNPFAKNPESLMYSTGDLVKYLPDKNILFIGRADNQVKIRGNRVELGEVEIVLQQCDLIQEAVVLATENKQGDKILVAYIIPASTYNKAYILSFLEDKIPDYMIPAIFIELQTFPLLPNGKIDRNSLPSPESVGDLINQYAAPETAVEVRLALLWQAVLEVEPVGKNDDFFTLGGHSLLAVKLVSAIRKAFNVEMPISDIFDFPTIALLATQIENTNISTVLSSIKIVTPRPIRIPLSYSQERLWFIDRLEGSVQYHLPAVLTFEGNLNTSALSYALQQVVNRHQVLRTVFTDKDGLVFQDFLPENNWQLDYIDRTLFKVESIQHQIAAIINKPFDLANDYMIRATLIKIAAEHHMLVVTVHHIASDGWSTSILINEAAQFYKAFDLKTPIELPELSFQYADFAIWQKDLSNVEILDKKINFWKQQLSGVSPLQLPSDFIRPVLQSRKGNIISFWIDKMRSNQIQQLGQQHGATVFMTLLAAFKVLLFRYSGQQDICVGTPVAGRQQPELENMIGFFVNTLAIRSQVNGDDTFIDLLQKVRNTTVQAYSHQEVPFEKVVDAVVKQRDTSRSPLFQVMFIFRNTPEVPTPELGEIKLERFPHEHTTSQFDLTLIITETPNGFYASVEYCTALYRQQSIEKMIVHFNQLLASIIAAPEQQIGQLKMLTHIESEELLVTFNNTAVEITDKNIIELFENQVDKNPTNIALVFEDTQLTYGELNERSNQLAHFLRSRNIGKEMLVPLCIKRGVEMVVGLLGILKAGAAYVPIDPEYPADRVQYMLQDCGASIILCSKNSRLKIPDSHLFEVIEIDNEPAFTLQSLQNMEASILPSQLAYVIYTSGSTGKPKGVMIEHASIVNLLQSIAKVINFTDESAFLSVTTFSFDICYLELFMPLIIGARLIVADRHTVMDGYKLSEIITKTQPTHLQATPATWQLLIGANWQNNEAIKMFVGGEALKDDLKLALTQRGDVWNVYGPTETTIWSTIKKLSTHENVLIGKPIANTHIQIVNTEGELVPVGVTGEILIGGRGLARGYYNRSTLTSQKFVPNKFTSDGSIMYRTGDVGRWHSDGNIECLGRIDDQVKIRGYRIELGEIETVLQQTGLVKQSVVVAREDKSGAKQLVGYVVAENEFDKEAVLSVLKAKLPIYMVPNLWVQLPELPLTPNGKIDKKSLPHPDVTELLTNQYVAPRNELELELAKIWQDVLQVERVGIHDSFFELGGHSLLTMRMVAEIEKTLLVSIPIKVLFQFVSINELSKYLEIELNNDVDFPGNIYSEEIII